MYGDLCCSVSHTHFYYISVSNAFDLASLPDSPDLIAMSYCITNTWSDSRFTLNFRPVSGSRWKRRVYSASTTKYGPDRLPNACRWYELHVALLISSEISVYWSLYGRTCFDSTEMCFHRAQILATWEHLATIGAWLMVHGSLDLLKRDLVII